MISRVAESCFWLFRYIERAESCSRLVSVNRLIVLDAEIGDVDRWKPVIVVLGEQARFEELLGVDRYHDDDDVQEYLTWSQENPVSIRSNLYWARENARMTREVISREMWETLNTWWQWFNGRAAVKEYKKDRSQFYQRIRSMCAEFQGISDSTMLHEEPLDFMRLGMLLERANQTARLMDVTHLRLQASEQAKLETPWQSAQWVSQLKLCAADEPFFKRNRAAPTGSAVAAFLLQDPTFPRSVRHCFERAAVLMASVEVAAERQGPTASLTAIRSMVERLRSADIVSVIQSGLHEELTRVVETAATVCDELNREFFDPTTDTPSARVSTAPPLPSLHPVPIQAPAQSQSQTQNQTHAALGASSQLVESATVPRAASSDIDPPSEVGAKAR